MKVSSGARVLPGWPLALATAALLAVSAPFAGTASAQEETRADKCAKTLEKNYGVAEPSDLDQRDASNRRSVYATGTTASGQTVRFRCLFGGGREAPEVQVYAEPEPGSPEDWPDWGPADEYKVPTEETPQDQQPQPTETDQAQGTPSEQPAETEQPAEAEQPAETEQAEQPEEAAEEPEQAQGPKRVRPETAAE